MQEKLWREVLEKKQLGQPFALLLVLESLGSSPGRQGFGMLVWAEGLAGSIGGGIMEHKMVEWAREMLASGKREILVKRQIHSKDSPHDRSGMICSGEQTIAFFFDTHISKALSEEICAAFQHQMAHFLEFTSRGIRLISDFNRQTGYFPAGEEQDWWYCQKLEKKPCIHIIGGGHVGLAFSQVMYFLGFKVLVYDHRKGLNTMEYNVFSHGKYVVDFDSIDQIIPEGDNEWVAIMTFGYRTDGQVIRKLLNKNFAYLGLLGSKAKIARMWEELRGEGFSSYALQSVFAPIGLSIKSQTPEEIAISIAAQIIEVRSRNK